MKNKMTEAIKNCKRKLQYMVCMAGIFCLLAVQKVSAASVPGIDGTKNLMGDVSRALLILIPVLMGLMLLVLAVKWYVAEEDEKKRFKKPAIATVAIGVFGELSSAIVTFVLSYYNS